MAANSELHLELRAHAGARPVLCLWSPTDKRELARARGWPVPFLHDASLRYRNAGAARKLELIAYSAADGGGTVDLLRDGRLIARELRLGAAPRAIAHGKGYTYFVAAHAGAATRAMLLALGEDGRLLGVSESGGPLGLPRLSGNASVRAIVLASATAGRFDVYANDPEDRDHDGLGRALERTLGTCDGPDDAACRSARLHDYYANTRHGTQDSDRDGLSDRDELLGVAGTPALDLPRWGASPRHKDVFVEVDRHTRAAVDGLSEDDLVAVARLFSRGSAAELRNLDGRPGVNMHFDVGFAPRQREHATLLGDWGGSNVVDSREYRALRNRAMAPSRRGYFRYALLSRQGTGQAFRDAFTINRDYHRVQVFAHELAHTLGLAHEGHARWGKANCKPSYVSVMNYVFQNREDLGFARGAAQVLDPVAVLERSRDLPAKALLSGPPFELDVVDADHSRSGGVDWNRDGLISDVPVRAGLLFATYKSCGASTAARSTLAKNAVAPATPALARLGDRLFAFWLDPTGRLMQRSGRVSGPDAHGSCPLGDTDKSRCMSFGDAHAVEGLAKLRFIAVHPAVDSNRLTLAYVLGDGSVHVATLVEDYDPLQSGAAVPDFAPKLYVATDVVVPGAVTHDAPALAYAEVDEPHYGERALWWLLFRAADGGGRLLQANARAPDETWHLHELRDARGEPIVTAQGPAALVLGTGELCGAFPDRESFVHFYCYAPARDSWVDLTATAFYAGLGPQTGSPVGLAYHRYRDANGAPIAAAESPERGAVYLSFSEPAPGTNGPPDNPNLFVSQWLDAAHGAFEQLDFRWRGTLDSQWTHLARGSTVTLYEDADLSALKTLMTHSAGGGLSVELFPLADGAFDAMLGGGSDFEVMERGICTGLRGEAACGDRSTGSY